MITNGRYHDRSRRESLSTKHARYSQVRGAGEVGSLTKGRKSGLEPTREIHWLKIRVRVVAKLPTQDTTGYTGRRL